MAERAVTIRLSEHTLETIDRMTEWFALDLRRKQTSDRDGITAPELRMPTRSNTIGACITGYLIEHRETIDSMLSELDS